MVWFCLPITSSVGGTLGGPWYRTDMMRRGSPFGEAAPSREPQINSVVITVGCEGPYPTP